LLFHDVWCSLWSAFLCDRPRSSFVWSLVREERKRYCFTSAVQDNQTMIPFSWNICSCFLCMIDCNIISAWEHNRVLHIWTLSERAEWAHISFRKQEDTPVRSSIPRLIFCPLCISFAFCFHDETTGGVLLELESGIREMRWQAGLEYILHVQLAV